MTRIVLDDETRAAIDLIQQKTKSPSPSAAIALLVSRYSQHLLDTWVLSPMRCPEIVPTVEPISSEPTPAIDENFQFTEPIDI